MTSVFVSTDEITDRDIGTQMTTRTPGHLLRQRRRVEELPEQLKTRLAAKRESEKRRRVEDITRAT